MLRATIRRIFVAVRFLDSFDFAPVVLAFYRRNVPVRASSLVNRAGD